VASLAAGECGSTAISSDDVGSATGGGGTHGRGTHSAVMKVTY